MGLFTKKEETLNERIKKIMKKDSLFLFEKSPAERWEESFLLGNGTFGASVFGDTRNERIVLNHDTPIKSSLIENNYDLALKIYKVQYCDCLAHHPEHSENRIKYLSKTREMFLRSQ